MKTLFSLTKRHIKLYLRDRTSLFFSFLTIIIIIALNMFFISKMNVDGLLEIIPVDSTKATHLIHSLTLAGIIFTSTLTVPLSVIGIMVQDEEEKRIMAYLVAPLSKFKLVLGYILASFIMGCFFAFVILAFSQGYMIYVGAIPLTLLQLLKIMGISIICVFSNACMVFFLTTFIHSSSSFSSLNIILGTLIGFIAAIYLPLGLLPEFMQKLLKCFPVFYGASLLREVYSHTLLDNLFANFPSSSLTDYANYMAITISWGDHTISMLTSLLILVGSGILFILLSTLVLYYKKGTDR